MATVPSETPSSASSPPATSEGLVASEYNVVRPSGVILEGIMINPCRVESTGKDIVPEGIPTIVMLHGLLSNRDHNFAPTLADALAKLTGHAVYRFDFRFSPQPDKEPGYRYRFSGFEDDVDDLRVVLRQLKKDGYAPWCLVGHSRGANDVLLASSKDEVLEEFSAAPGLHTPKLAVAALAARFTMPDMFKRIFSEDQQRAVDDDSCGNQFVWASKRGELVVTRGDADVVRLHMDMAAVTRRIPAGVPALHVHGADDEVIAVDDARNFVPCRREAQPDCDSELVVVEGARHAFAGKKPQRALVELVASWVLKQASAMEIPVNPWPLSPADKGSKATAAAKAARTEKFSKPLQSPAAGSSPRSPASIPAPAEATTTETS